MRMAIPVETKVPESRVHASFGRAAAFMIYDSATEQSSFFANPAVSSQGGAGIQTAQIIADEGVDVVVTSRLGNNAANVLQAAGIRLLQSCPGSAAANIQACLEQKLQDLQTIHAGLHRH